MPKVYVLPPKERKIIDSDPWYKQCRYRDCPKPVEERHHALQYAGKRIQKAWAIIPLCTNHHRGSFGTISRAVKDYCTWLAILRGQKELVVDYPKFDWVKLKNALAKQLFL